MLNSEATSQEIDFWFQSTPQDNLISDLAKLVSNACSGKEAIEVNRLRLSARLSQEEIMILLKTEPRGHDTTLIHYLASTNHTSAFIALLDEVKIYPHLRSIVSVKDSWYRVNVLSGAVIQNKLTIIQYLIRRLGEEECFRLLSEQDFQNQRTGLHWAVTSSEKILPLLRDNRRVSELLAMKDGEGRTVLSYSIHENAQKGFRSILRHYADKSQQLLELAAARDSQGNTSFHYAVSQRTPDFLTSLIQATYSQETREKLAKVLSQRNEYDDQWTAKKGAKNGHATNAIIYEWALESLNNFRYLLFDLPSVFVMYNTFSEHPDKFMHRIGADDEAQSLIKCMEQLGFEVQHSNAFTKGQLFQAIREHQASGAGRNGQIVALMSHGSKGYIHDKEGERILLSEIEENMCANTDTHTPKLLILQCCQVNDEASSLPRESLPNDAGGRNIHVHQSYCPRHADFCALVSSGPGTYSERNVFIPELAEVIENIRIEADISEVMGLVKRKFPKSNPNQAPLCLDGLKYSFCLKTILPIYLRIKGKCKQTTQFEVDELTSTEYWQKILKDELDEM